MSALVPRPASEQRAGPRDEHRLRTQQFATLAEAMKVMAGTRPRLRADVSASSAATQPFVQLLVSRAFSMPKNSQSCDSTARPTAPDVRMGVSSTEAMREASLALNPCR